MKTTRHSQRGLSFFEIFLVLATIALLGVVFLPMLARSHARSSKTNCVNCLKQVGLAFRLWSEDHHEQFPFASPDAEGSLRFANSPQVFRHFVALSNELATPRTLLCPNDSKRTKASDFSKLSNGNISYFVGLDADQSKPERLLSGDRNITGGTLSNGFMRLLQPTTAAGWAPEIHTNAGNIGLSDGSVNQVDPLGLRRQLRTNTLPLIRLAIP